MPDEGAGGVWLPGEIPVEPMVWRIKWPQDKRNWLVTQNNPTGDITNSDLEMVAEVLGWLALKVMINMKWLHVGVCSNNLATVAWQTRGNQKDCQWQTGCCES